MSTGHGRPRRGKRTPLRPPVTGLESYLANVSRNRALEALLARGCDDLFVIEPETRVLDSRVFEQYAAAARASGLGMLSFARTGPQNLRPMDLEATVRPSLGRFASTLVHRSTRGLLSAQCTVFPSRLAEWKS